MKNKTRMGWKANGMGRIFPVIRRDGNRALVANGKKHEWVAIFSGREITRMGGTK